MRYALISDIHANLPALSAVIEDIGRRPDIGGVYHLGDLVGYAPWPNEELSHLSYDWTRRHTSATTKHQLGLLPFRIDLRPLGGHVGGPSVILVHGTPTLNTVYWTEDRPADFCTRMAAVAGAKEGGGKV